MLEKIALQKKLISKEDCQKAIQACKASKDFETALKSYFIANGLLSANTIEQLIYTTNAIKIIKKARRFGMFAVKLGFITQDILDKSLRIQRKSISNKERPMSIGKILLDTGKLTKKQIGLIISEQKRLIKKSSTEKQKRIQPARQNPDKVIQDDIKPGNGKPENEKAEGLKKAEPKDLSDDDKPASEISENIQGGMILVIDAEGMNVFLRKTKVFNDTFMVEDILSILAMRSIHHGFVKDEVIEGFINSSGFYKNQFKIASGTPRVVGKDARIEYYFDTDHLKAGGMDEEGNIDFKDRGEIPKVEENNLLAEKFPMEISIIGRDVYGNEIPAEPVKDKALKCRNGVVLSEDGSKAYSEIMGHPKLSWSGNISVVDTYVDKGDVGYETGHLNYSGNIDVKGCLKSGFQVNGYDVKIKEIDGGEIRAEGDVTILNGVNDAKIYSRGHVRAKFIHNSTISCLGNVYIEKEIVDSTIESSGSCQIKSGKIINSKIFSNQGIVAKNIGTEKTNPNIITVGEDYFLKNELIRLDRRIIDSEKEMMGLEKIKQNLSLEIQNNHEFTTRIANELDRTLGEMHQLELEIEMLEKQNSPEKDKKHTRSELFQKSTLFNRLDRELNDRFDVIEGNKSQIEKIDKARIELGDLIDDYTYEKANFVDWGESNIGKSVVTASGKVCSGTIVKGKHSQKEIKETIRNVQLKECNIQVNSGDTNLYEIQIHDTTKRR